MKYRTAFLTAGSVVAALASPAANAGAFEIHSQAIRPGALVPPEYFSRSFGCSGSDFQPDLAWSHIPAGTRSLAVTFYDRDAPTGSGFWHWVAYDIPVDTAGLPGGAGGGPLPPGAVEGNTDMGKPGFLGPCPPSGRLHRYVFTLHALKVEKLPVERGASPALVGFVLWQNDIATTRLEVRARRRK